MKLTRKQLQTIIKEELEAAIEEGHGGMMTPKRVFFDVIIPALESAGFMGLDAMKMAKDAVDAAFGMGSEMMAPMLEEGINPQSDEEVDEILKNVQELIKTGEISKLGDAYLIMDKVKLAAERNPMINPNAVAKKIERLEKERKEASRKWAQENNLLEDMS